MHTLRADGRTTSARITSIKGSNTQPLIPAHDHQLSYLVSRTRHSSPCRPLSLTLTCSFSLAHSSPLSFSYSPASVPRTYSGAPSSRRFLSRSNSLLLLRRSLARRDRLYGKARVIPTAEIVLRCNPVCLTSYEPRLSHADHSGTRCRRRSHVRTASSRKSNLKIFENNNKMAGKSLRDHCGQTMAMIGSAPRAWPIGAMLCGCFL